MLLRRLGLLMVVLFLVGLVGCEDSGQRKPMDEPLRHGDAMEADEAMRKSAEDLLRESEAESSR